MDGGVVSLGELGEAEDFAGDDARAGGVVEDDGGGAQGWAEGEEVGCYLFHDGGGVLVG